MSSKVFAFNVAQEVPAEEMFQYSFEYDPEEQAGTWIGDNITLATSWSLHCSGSYYGFVCHLGPGSCEHNYYPGFPYSGGNCDWDQVDD